jgi:hypothetical protein
LIDDERKAYCFIQRMSAPPCSATFPNIGAGSSSDSAFRGPMRDLSAISLAMQFDLSFVQRLHGSDRQHCPVPIPRRPILCPYLLLRFVSGTVFCGELRMTLIMAEDEVLSVAIAGVPKVAEFIARVPMEDRSRALDAAEKSYLETEHTLGYQDAKPNNGFQQLCRDCA